MMDFATGYTTAFMAAFGGSVQPRTPPRAPPPAPPAPPRWAVRRGVPWRQVIGAKTAGTPRHRGVGGRGRVEAVPAPPPTA